MTNDFLRCPHCHMPVDLAEILTLTARQEVIRAAIRHYRRHLSNGKLPSSREITAILHTWAELGKIDDALAVTGRTVRIELRYLEAIRVLNRPNGPNSGYAEQHHHLTLISPRRLSFARDAA